MVKHPHAKYFAKAAEALEGLPVSKVVDDVVKSVQAGKVTVLTAETGSGKTLLASSKLADESDHQVVVLVPRRFLAENAAKSIAEISGTTVGKEVGYAIGKQSGDKSLFSPHTKLLFATYGYALSSGLLDTAKTIVCDEVHEAGIDTSLARAIIHRRLKFDKDLRVMEMSATVNAKKQADYWKDVKGDDIATFHAEGQAYPCDFRHDTSDKPIVEIARDLIKNEGRKGIAIFRPGVKEVEKTAEALIKLFHDSHMDNVDVAMIYGDMDMEEREKAARAPEKGRVKVLVGTNVMESGVNIKWLDTGISDGLCKVKYHRDSGAEALVTQELPQWRIIQQKGRIHRFTDGIFILHSAIGMNERPIDIAPEITRVSPMGLVLQAANYNINPLELKYDAEINPEKLVRGKEDLMRLDLLDDNWKLTEKGRYVADQPLGAEAGSMLWAAPEEILSEAIELAAIVEVGGLRADFAESHKMDRTSDTLDALKIFKKLGYEADEETCGKHNVSWKRYKEVREYVKDIHHRHGIALGEQSRPATDSELRQIMLHGSVNHLFEMHKGTFGDLAHSGKDRYHPDRESVVGPTNNGERFAIAGLREMPFSKEAMAQNITPISTGAFLKFAVDRPGTLTDITFEQRKGRKRYNLTALYCGVMPITINIPKIVPPDLSKLIEPAYSEFCKQADRESPPDQEANKHQPQGVHNTAAWEAQAERKSRKHSEAELKRAERKREKEAKKEARRDKKRRKQAAQEDETTEVGIG